MEEKKQESVTVFNGIEMRISSLDEIWLTQKQIAQVFETSKQLVRYHINAFLKELDDEQIKSTVKRGFTVQYEGNREISREVMLYNFEVICQVGYKIDCKKGFRFRQFATKAIREKLNRELLNRDDELNNLRIEREALKARLGEAVMEISGLERDIDYLKQYEPNESDYGKTAKNGFPRTTYQRGGFKSRGGRKVELKPQYVTVDLLAVAKYLQ